jgi:peptidoglycan/LPS O-acetylase OafA/YrhL
MQNKPAHFKKIDTQLTQPFTECSMRFSAIEGLRGILAWAVVFSHLTYISAFNLKGVSSVLRWVGLPAVLVFIIISGFVITHTILEKQEHYLPYLVRRFFRIFPLFAVMCLVGFFTSELLASALADPGFGDPTFAKVVNEVALSDQAFLSTHILAHLFMVHGAIPNILLPHSEYAFNMPGWSISLEWQFYLVAPMVVLCLTSKRWMIPLIVSVLLIDLVAAKTGQSTTQPGALPYASGWFAIGIFSRLFYLDRFYVPGTDWLLKSRPALYFGSRSYSIYLCHYPVVSVVAWLLFRWSVPSGMFTLSAISIPLIIVTAELAYRWIEKPGIAAGRTLANITSSMFQLYPNRH